MLIYYNKNLKVDLVNDSDYLYDEVIGFIKEKEFIENPDSKEKDFNVFYSYHPFGIEKKNNYKYCTCLLFHLPHYICPKLSWKG